MADQEIDKLLLEINVEDKTQGGSEKLVESIATAVSKLNAEIAKLDTSKLENVTKALSAIGGGVGGTAKGAISKQSEEVSKLNAELNKLEKERNRILKEQPLGKGGGTLGEMLSKISDENAKDIKKEYGLDVIDEKIKDLKDKISTAPPQAQGGGTKEELTKKVSEQRQYVDLLDAQKTRIDEINELLDEGDITAKEYIARSKERLSIEKSISKVAQDTQEQEKVKNLSGKISSQLDLDIAKLKQVQSALEKKGLTEKQYLSLRQQELTLAKKIETAHAKMIVDNKTEVKHEKSKLVASIKRVAVYRLIRGALKAVLNAFKEGFTNLAGYSKEVNNTLSQLTSSFTVMKNSVAVAFLPLLNIITPVIQRISVSIANLANVISYLTAKLQGNATYLKVNTEYFKKFNEQSRLLSFDTFEKLGNGVDYSKMFEEANIADGFDNSKLTEALTILTAISATLITIGGSKLIKSLHNGVLKTKISDISGVLSTVKGQIATMSIGIGLLTAGIASLVTNWNDVNFEAWEKGVTIALALAAAVVGVYVALKALQLPLASAIGLGLALAGAVALVGTTIGKNTPKNYAFGGGYNSADLFYANENGKTELVASTNSGGGAVMNMQQLESAIYSGMVKAMASGENGECAIYFDGDKVGTFIAGNSGFRSEANRRNTGLNWR